MSHPFSTPPSFYVLDVGEVIELYQYDHVIHQMFPQITLQSLIAIIFSTPAVPYHDEVILETLSKFLKSKFEAMADIQSIELAIYDIRETLDQKIEMAAAQCNHSTSYFWRWLDSRTLVLAHHHEPSVQHLLQAASIRAMEDYIYQSDLLLRPTF